MICLCNRTRNNNENESYPNGSDNISSRPTVIWDDASDSAVDSSIFISLHVAGPGAFDKRFNKSSK